MAAEREKPMPDAEVNAWLQKNLPKWHLENGWIRRTYKTSGWKGTLMVINTVGHLAEAAWHHPDITASYAWVEVRLMTHTAKGITQKDFELAKKIEDVVHWQPGKEDGALEGTPHGGHAVRLHKIRLIGVWPGRWRLALATAGCQITSSAFCRLPYSSEPRMSEAPSTSYAAPGVRLHRRARLEPRRQGRQHRPGHRAADRGGRRAAPRALAQLRDRALGQDGSGLVRQRLHRRGDAMLGPRSCSRAARRSSAHGTRCHGEVGPAHHRPRPAGLSRGDGARSRISSCRTRTSASARSCWRR